MNERKIFDGSDNDSPDSVFHEPVFLQDAAVERVGTPIRAEDLAQRIQIGEMASGRAQSCIDRIRDGVEEILAPYLPENVASVADAIGRNHKEIVERKQRLDLLVAALEKLKPGKGITISVDDEMRHAIITRIDYPNRGYEHVPGLYGVEFVIPGDENPRSMRLETLLKDERFTVNEGLEGDNYDKVLKSYDDASKVKFRQVRLLTHNIFRAMRMNVEHRFGPLVTYRSADGAVHRGVMVTGAHRNLKNLPIEVSTADMAYSAVVAGVEINGDKGMGDKTFSMKLADEGGVEIYLPPRMSKRHGHIYDDAAVEALRLTAKAENKRGFRLVVRRDELNGVLTSLFKAGAKFWANEIHRDKWLADYRKQRGEGAVPAEEEPAPAP